MEVLFWTTLLATAIFVAVTEISYRKVLKQIERAEAMLWGAHDLRRRLVDFGREIEAERKRGH